MLIDFAHAQRCAWLQGQFQNAYPELMRLSSYRIAAAVEAPDGTCSVAVDVASGPEVGAKHAETMDEAASPQGVGLRVEIAFRLLCEHARQDS